MSPNVKQKDTEFLTISARIKAKEVQLLDTATAEKLIEADSMEEVVKLLGDKGYETSGLTGCEPDFLSRLIAADRAQVAALIAAAGKGLFDLFLYPNDYHNIKVALKNELTDEPRDIFTTGGSVPTEVMKAAVETRSFEALTPLMAEGIEEAAKAARDTGNPQFVDIVLDRYCYRDMAQAAEKIGSPFLTGYVRQMVDVANVKSLLRLRRMGKPYEFAARVFFDGGSVEAEKFAQAYGAADEELPGMLCDAGIFCKQAIEELGGGEGGMAAFELYCDNYLMEYIKTAKYIAFGAEVPAAYLLAKETEYKVISIILAGKAAHLAGDTIRERVRSLYV
ncbi:V-type sodium ATPase subunit C [bioreactor metagenome]|uniref:V-type sodium ATPase subunit C n=1 Tax=bioreactor metagenome TaxID=1076179 RepID=A0A644YGH0_9ZZZZ